jgi:hypothetical protein
VHILPIESIETGTGWLSGSSCEERSEKVMIDFTIPELKHLLEAQGLWSAPGCPMCDTIRMKLETMISERQQEWDRSMGIAGREHVGGSNPG